MFLYAVYCNHVAVDMFFGPSGHILGPEHDFCEQQLPMVEENPLEEEDEWEVEM